VGYVFLILPRTCSSRWWLDVITLSSDKNAASCCITAPSSSGVGLNVWGCGYLFRCFFMWRVRGLEDDGGWCVDWVCVLPEIVGDGLDQHMKSSILEVFGAAGYVEHDGLAEPGPGYPDVVGLDGEVDA